MMTPEPSGPCAGSSSRRICLCVPFAQAGSSWSRTALDEAGCLVLDVRMPEMDGLEVQQRLWERNIGLPIIFITAHGDVPTCAQAFKAGALEFLEKPVDHAILLGSHPQSPCAQRGTETSGRVCRPHRVSLPPPKRRFSTC